MKLSQLRYFQMVCKHGNVTKASNELHISQPSVSSSIKELEAEFGVDLFSRQNKKLTPTKEGEYFLEKATEILYKVDLLGRQMRDFAGTHNNIQVGLPPMIGNILFPQMFIAFRQQHPQIRVELLEQGSVATWQSVQEEQLDLALVILANEVKGKFNFAPIFDTQLVFCVAKSHPMAKKKIVRLAELKDESLILMKSDSHQNVLIKNQFNDLGIEPNIVLYSSQLLTIKNFIKSGLAGAFLINEVVKNDPSLVGIPLENPIPLQVGIIWKKNKQLYSDVSHFINFVKKYEYK